MLNENQNKIILIKILYLLFLNIYFKEEDPTTDFINDGDKYASIPDASDMKITAAINASIYPLKNGMIGSAYFLTNCFLIILNEKIMDNPAITINMGILIKF